VKSLRYIARTRTFTRGHFPFNFVSQVLPSHRSEPATRISLRCLVATIAVFSWSAAVLADEYPSRTIRFIVPGAAGGIVDIHARKVADMAGRSLGKPVVVENKPGSGGNLGAEIAAKSKPDGYTVFLGSTSIFCVSPFVYSNLTYDAMRDFIPLTMGTIGSPLLLVDPRLPVGTLEEFIAYVKKNPGKLSYGSPGVGSAQHLAMELLKQLTGIELIHVPYKNAPQVLTDLIGGEIQATFEYVAATAQHMKAGKIRGLVNAGPYRKPEFPEIPTSTEAGLPGLTLFAWHGYFVPRGTPPEVAAKLQAALAAAIRNPDYSAWARSQGSEMGGQSSAEFAEFIRRDRELWKEIVRKADVRLE
jgi:tripartite-type tricarboxylate transporter receptor subunit TctC